MKKNIKQIIIFIITMFLCSLAFSTFHSKEVKALGFTDVENINDGFLFNENNLSDDMAFQGAPQPVTDNFWNTIYEKYRVLIILASGALSLGFVGLFIVNITKYGASAGNPQARSQAIKTLMWTGIAAALFGIITLLTAISYTFFVS